MAKRVFKEVPEPERECMVSHLWMKPYAPLWVLLEWVEVEVKAFSSSLVEVEDLTSQVMKEEGEHDKERVNESTSQSHSKKQPKESIKN
jgi:hypothetical protein